MISTGKKTFQYLDIPGDKAKQEEIQLKQESEIQEAAKITQDLSQGYPNTITKK